MTFKVIRGQGQGHMRLSFKNDVWFHAAAFELRGAHALAYLADLC